MNIVHSVFEPAYSHFAQNSEALVQSVCNVELYGDERDKMIMRVNQLAASLGVGSAQYKRDHQPVTFNQQGPFFRFKVWPKFVKTSFEMIVWKLRSGEGDEIWVPLEVPLEIWVPLEDAT